MYFDCERTIVYEELKKIKQLFHSRYREDYLKGEYFECEVK